MRHTRNVLATLMMIFAVTFMAAAQSSKGIVVGTVKDPNGAIVSGANVKITNTKTGVARDTVTTPEGTYRFEAVEPGNYNIDVNAPGFKQSEVQNVVAGGGQTSDYPVTLELGS